MIDFSVVFGMKMIAVDMNLKTLSSCKSKHFQIRF